MTETKLKKNQWNLIMFIISYTINNIISGIVYDVYINYLQDTSENLAKSFWSYYGYSAFVGAFLLLFISKIGYKKIVIFCSLACSVTLIAAAYFKETYIFYFSTLFILTGIQLHFSVLSPYIATYADFKEKIKWFSRAFYIGYVGFFLSTYLGGYFVVKLFAKYIGKTFEEAKEITAAILEMNEATKGLYIDSMEKVLIVSGIISLLALIPAFLIKEEKEDYIYQKQEKHTLIEIKKNLKKLYTKNTIVYLIYWGLTNFGMGLFTSYFTVFLNRVLHIDKATSSLLVSISYVAMVVFMLFTDRCVKKFGQVVTLVGASMLAIPFMLIIAQGDKFGNSMIVVVGISLFIRAGLMNLSSPIDSSFSMEIVEPELRPIYASIINFIAGIASIVSGHYTGKYLFVTVEGYRQAYYIAAVIYGIASLIFVLNFMKYNKISSEEEMK